MKLWQEVIGTDVMDERLFGDQDGTAADDAAGGDDGGEYNKAAPQRDASAASIQQGFLSRFHNIMRRKGSTPLRYSPLCCLAQPHSSCSRVVLRRPAT